MGTSVRIIQTEAEEPDDTERHLYLALGAGVLWGMENWWGRANGTLWKWQDTYLQGQILNLNKASPGATTKLVWGKDPRFHSIISFLGVFCYFILFLFLYRPFLIWQDMQEEEI